MKRRDKTLSFVDRQNALRERWTAPPRTHNFRVVTWNVHMFEGPFLGEGGDSRRDCARLLSTLQPDVVLLQEDPTASNLFAEFGYSTPRLMYSAHDKGMGLTVVSRSPLTNVRVHKLSSDGEEEERGVLMCDSVTDMGHQYTVACCHLEPYRPEEWNRQCLSLCEHIRGAMILGGDFNSVGAPAALRRASLQADSNRGYTCWFGNRIDMVFSTAHFTCADTWAVPSGLSDHRPVVVDYLCDDAETKYSLQ